jgi:hypothetical protein
MTKQQYEAGWRCPACGLAREMFGGPDPCIGHLPGVKFACCGHGLKGNCPAYLCFDNDVTLRITVHAVEHSKPVLKSNEILISKQPFPDGIGDEEI